MKIRRCHVARFRNLVSAVFDALALLEWGAAALVLPARFLLLGRFPAIGPACNAVALSVLALVFLQGLMFAAVKFAQSREEVRPEEQARKGYRGYEGGTPRKVSRRMRRRMVAALSSGAVS